MILRHVKVRNLTLNDYQQLENVAFSVTATHNMRIEEGHYECLTEISIEQNEQTILNAHFLSMLERESTDLEDEAWLHQTSLEQIYPHIRAIIISLMSSAMIQPILLPLQAPQLDAPQLAKTSE